MKTVQVLEEVLAGKRLAKSSVANYRLALGSLAEVSAEFPSSGREVNRWYGSLVGKADTTVRLWFTLVNSAGAYLEKAYGKKADGTFVYPNPCRDAEKPRVEKKRRRYFNAVEIVRIIRACRLGIDKVLILTLIDSACRIGELVGLRSSNVGDSWIDVSGKTGERRYRLDPALSEELRRVGGEEGVIFARKDGKDATVEALKQRVRKVIREAGITGKKVGAHTLRHSGASLVAEETGSALVVKALLQHDNINTSMGYIHDAEEKIAQGISPLALVGEKVFGSAFAPESRQLTMGEESEGEFTEVPEEVDVVESLMALEFREIEDGLSVRSVLRSEDLRLIRTAFVRWCDDGASGEDMMKCRELFKRMLRKVR